MFYFSRTTISLFTPKIRKAISCVTVLFNDLIMFIRTNCSLQAMPNGYMYIEGEIQIISVVGTK